MHDSFDRKITYLRISITDLCNLRCIYCMPKNGVKLLRHEDILTFEEIERLVSILAAAGIRKVRLTGGEPLVRRGVTGLVGKLSAVSGIEGLHMTTNGILLKGMADELKKAGLQSVNISLDTLNKEQFKRLSGGGNLADVIKGIDAARSVGLKVRLNCVPVIGYNERDIVSLCEFAAEKGTDLRFIELMPIGEAVAYRGIDTARIMDILAEHFGEGEMLGNDGGPAVYYRFPGMDPGRNGSQGMDPGRSGLPGMDPEWNESPGMDPGRNESPGMDQRRNESPKLKMSNDCEDGTIVRIGFISPLSESFCDRCNRIRLTADGYLKLCLHHSIGVDVRTALRDGSDDECIRELITNALNNKPSSHDFTAGVSDPENRRMVQIGG